MGGGLGTRTARRLVFFWRVKASCGVSMLVLVWEIGQSRRSNRGLPASLLRDYFPSIFVEGMGSPSMFVRGWEAGGKYGDCFC